MIELTDAELAMYADVLEAYPCRREYLLLGRRYDLLWEHSRTGDMRGRRQEIADLCVRMADISAGRGDRYRVAMRRRRAFLHLAGDEGKVYGACDALKWGKAMRRALDGGTLPATQRRILGTVLGMGDVGIPGQGVAMLLPAREEATEGAA
jgi:hypothetical protein